MNSYFEAIPDAIEYLNCVGGRIGKCEFFNMNDDAIDLNHCSNTLIDSNLIVNTGNRAMEIGSENNGPSINIHVYRNTVLNCAIGINFKEGSTGLIENNTIVGNQKGVTSIASGRPNIGSSIKVINTIFHNNTIPVYTDDMSSTSVTYSSSSTILMDGESNLLSDPFFVNEQQLNFNLKLSSKCIDSGKNDDNLDKDDTVADMGAFYFHQTQRKGDGLIKIGPNPVSDELLVWSDDPFETIRIYDIRGALRQGSSFLISNSQLVPRSQLVTRIDVSNLKREHIF